MAEQVMTEVRGKRFRLETGKLGKQANGCVELRYGDVVLLSTCVMGVEKEEIDYFPLQVNYQEKYYAVGKIPGGFIKREGRPRDREILISRLIDRPIRPLFPERFRREVQVIVTTMAADQENSPDILGIIGASAALGVSDIPFEDLVGAVRVGRIGKEYIINPSFEELNESHLDLVVAGTREKIMMLEGEGGEVGEEELIGGIEYGKEVLIQMIELQEELVRKAGKEKVKVYHIENLVDEKWEEEKKGFGEVLERDFERVLEGEGMDLEEGLKKVKEDFKEDFKEGLLGEKKGEKLGEKNEEKLEEKLEEKKVKELEGLMEEIEHKVVKGYILRNGKRLDGRGLEEIRQMSCEIGVLPRVHGSSLFTRGETQSMGVVTLGTEIDMQRFDDIEGERRKLFMLHYNFPPYSVGEVGKMGVPSRREIGHGALAEKSLLRVLPDEEDFPYTIRVVSEILESNGSSSMATVCSGSMALLDAGVPIKKSVGGVAMGMIRAGGEYRILTDIQGVEDHIGAMDLKVAGTEEGITAIQLDIKGEGIDLEILREGLRKARAGRLKVIEKMEETIKDPSEYLSEYAPKIISVRIAPEKVKDVIGPSGRMIKKIIEETKASVDIDVKGKVIISSKKEEEVKLAYEKIKLICAEVEVGKIYKGVVKKVTDFGAFIEILPGKEGLCHISNLSNHRVRRVIDVCEEGDEVFVKCLGVDGMGKISLSMKGIQNQKKLRV